MDETNPTTTSTGALVPPKPEEPLDSECCGTGCTPCVFDIYKDKLERWKEECENITTKACNFNENSSNDIISPYEYAMYIVTDITDDCQSCKLIHFQTHSLSGSEEGRRKSVKSFPVKIGQHIVLKINDKSRQYTILDVVEDGSFRIIFKIYENGWLTPSVDKLIVGDLVQMRGPFGKEFHYMPNSYGALIMLAAGTGIAPFCRIIEQVLNNENDDSRIVLMFACRNEKEVLLLNKLKEWSRSWNFQVQYFLSDVIDANAAPKFHYGMNVKCNKKIDETELKLLLSTCKGLSMFLICGTKSFEKDMVKYLNTLEITEDRIKLF